MTMTMFDDNFGAYEIRDEDDVEFYWEMQRSNVEKKCRGCGRLVRIQPNYAYCNTCADKLERGLDLDYIGDEPDETELTEDEREEQAEAAMWRTPAALRAQGVMEAEFI